MNATLSNFLHNRNPPTATLSLLKPSEITIRSGGCVIVTRAKCTRSSATEYTVSDAFHVRWRNIIIGYQHTHTAFSICYTSLIAMKFYDWAAGNRGFNCKFWHVYVRSSQYKLLASTSKCGLCECKWKSRMNVLFWLSDNKAAKWSCNGLRISMIIILIMY